MKILWDAEKPMIASEIVRSREDLNINTVQAVLRSLIKKQYIKVADIVYSGTVLTRSYVPIVDRKEYPDDIEEGIRNTLKSQETFSCYINEIDDIQILSRLEDVIKKRKKDRLPGLTGSRSFFNFKYYFLYAPTFPSPISCPIFRMWSPIRSKSVSISE